MLADDGQYRLQFSNTDYAGKDPRRCNMCGKTLSFSEAFTVTTCMLCRKEEARQERKQRLLKLKELPVSERLARIEKWLDDHEDCHPMKEILGS